MRTSHPRRTVAAATALAAGLAGAAVVLVAPTAQAAPRIVDLAFNARSFGASITTNDVTVRPLKLGFANSPCTRTLGKQTSAQAGNVPVGDLIDLRTVRSTNRTYRSQNRFGMRSVNTIATAVVGQGSGPRLTIRGLQTTANAFRQGNRLQTQESFTFEGIGVTGVPGAGGPLGELLDAIDGGAAEVLALLREQNAPIEIPGLVRLSLATPSSNVDGTSAASRSTGLKLELLVGNLATVTLGDAYARVGRPATAGVLNLSTQALDGAAVRDLIGVGATNRRTIGCEGTQGRTETFRRASSGIVSPVLVDIRDSVAQQRGKQNGPNANAFTRSTVGTVQIVPDALSPLLPTVTVRNVEARVGVRGNFSKKGSKRVIRDVSTRVGGLLIDGRRVTMPRPGNTRSYDGGNVQVTRHIVRHNFFGADATAIRVRYLPNLLDESLRPLSLDLGVVNGHFYRG